MTQKRIVIQEDDDEIRKTVACYLSKHGFSTVTTSNPNDCLSACKEKSPNLLLISRTFHFQEGIDLVKQLRSDPVIPHFPIIVTGVEPPFDLHYYSAGVNTCIGVVFDLILLLDEINKLL